MQNTKKILIIPYSQQLGSTHTMIEIGNILRRQGYLVEFAGEGPYLKFASDLGFIVHKLIEIPIQRYREKTDKAELDYLSKEEIVDFIKAEEDLFKTLKPDLIIDTLRPTVYISARRLGIPRVSLTYAVLTKHYKGALNVPESHFLYVTKKIPFIYNLLSKYTVKIRDLFYWKFAKTYREILKEEGVNNKVSHDDLTEGNNTLIFDLPEFYPIEKLPPKYSFIGPILLNLPVKIPDWLQKLNELKNKGKKIVYLSMGSSGGMYPKILKYLLELSKKMDFVLVATSLLHEQEKAEESYNVFLKDFVPADTVLPLADLVVTHGGKGTIYHSLKHGVPLVGIAHQAEQEWNLERIKELGLGDYIGIHTFDMDIFIKKVIDVLGSTEIKMNSVKFKENFEKFNIEKAVTDAIKKIFDREN